MKILPITLAMLILAMIPHMSHAIEEPEYEVLRTVGEVELRQYAPYVVAEVLIQGPAMEAGNKAFPILAGYIFGKNKGERKFAMTAPVTQTAAPLRMAMTAPVAQTEGANGTVVQFVLPKGVTLASAPEPLDARVMLREVPGVRVGAIRYSGFWSESNNQAQLTRLQTELQAANLAWTGEPTYARYNGPMTPWFMRRNEIWLTLR